MKESPILLDGNRVAADIKNQLAKRISRLADKGIVPCLATVLVGADPASATYVRMKGNACERIGIRSIRIELPEAATTEQLIGAIRQLNEDGRVHGILLQHPVPRHIDERAAFDAISIEKDVDGVTTLGFAQ